MLNLHFLLNCGIIICTDFLFQIKNTFRSEHHTPRRVSMDIIFLSMLALGMAIFVFGFTFYKFVWPKSKKRTIVCVALTSVCNVILFLVMRTIFGNISGNFVLSIVFTIAIDIVAILIAWRYSKEFVEPFQYEFEEPEEPVRQERPADGAQAPGHVGQEIK